MPIWDPLKSLHSVLVCCAPSNLKNNKKKSTNKKCIQFSIIFVETYFHGYKLYVYVCVYVYVCMYMYMYVYTYTHRPLY